MYSLLRTSYEFLLPRFKIQWLLLLLDFLHGKRLSKMTYIYVMPIHENYNGYGFLENGG